MTEDERRALVLAEAVGFRMALNRQSEPYALMPSLRDDLTQMLIKLVFSAQADVLDTDGR